MSRNLSQNNTQSNAFWFSNLNNGVVHSENDFWEHYPEWEEERYRLTLKYGSAIAGGLSRLVFKTGYGVCKLSYPEYGEFNFQELYNDLFPVAKCRIAKVTDAYSILMMEWVNETFEHSEELPEWVAMTDGNQVGYNRAGNLVAFDGCI